MTTDPVNHADL